MTWLRTVCVITLLPMGACAGLPAYVKTPADPTRAPLVRYQGLSGPAGIYYDAPRDRYLVSNINGAPTAEDGNGYISVLSPDGQVVEEHWIGGKPGSILNAPKGLTVKDDTVYVADISFVRRFDVNTGEALEPIPVEGSTYLHDIITADDGKIYVTDAGAPTGRFDGKGTEAIYVIEQNSLRLLVDGVLNRPDGLAWTKDGLVVTGFQFDEVFKLGEKGAVKREITKAPAGGLSGLVRLNDGSFAVSSWQGSAVYRGELGGKFVTTLSGQKSPSDVGYDSKRSRLLVPHFEDGTVEVFALD